MGAATFVIAILGCADGGSACAPVTTLPARYESVQQCEAARAPALEANTDFDFPTLIAQCRQAKVPTSAAPAPRTAGRTAVGR